MLRVAVALAVAALRWLQVALRHDLSARIRQIRKRLDEISANRAAYNIEHAPAPALAASSATTLAAWYARSQN
jgi:hypothetical protein